VQHAEVIYETGAHSVVSFDDIDELKAGLAEHHRRAISGEDAQANLPRPAERVSKVIIYPEHPAGDTPDYSVDADTVSSLLSGMAQSGKINGNQLIEAVRDEMSPVYPVDQGRHQSMYKAEGEELPLDFLSDTAGA